jgi:hypothetical protein
MTLDRNRSKVINVIDSHKLEHDAENRFALFGIMLKRWSMKDFVDE